MKKPLTFIFLLLPTVLLKAQSDTFDITFSGFYEVREDMNGNKYFSILFDSTFYENENLRFIRVFYLGNRPALANSLSPAQEYTVVIQRKLQYADGCGNDLLNIRSNRGMMDVGTLFGSNFLEERKSIAKEHSCDYKVIEYYYILEIRNKN